MTRLVLFICLAVLIVGCSSVAEGETEQTGHDGFELISITRVRVLSLTEDESTFKAVYRITNESAQNLLCVSHPYYLDWEVQNRAGDAVSPTIMFKMGPPSPKDVEIVKPGEERVFTIESLPYKNSSLGFSPRARLVFNRWSIAGIREDWWDKTKLEGVCFPAEAFYTSWR